MAKSVKSVTPFLFTFPSKLAEPWSRFLLNDDHLLISGLTGVYEPLAIFIGSIETAQSCLVGCGELLAKYNATTFVFRTDNSVVEGWAKRFSATRSTKEGHRDRYLMISAEWNCLCLMAYQRNQ